jgi:hypothetical protein
MIEEIPPSVAAGAKVRIFDGKNTSPHGSKHETAALTAMPNCIAHTLRKGYASPDCIRPQPAISTRLQGRISALLICIFCARENAASYLRTFRSSLTPTKLK